MKKTRALIAEADALEARVFDALRETTEATRRLALACRANQALVLAFAEARGREGGRRLVELLAAEHAARGKASKGAKDGPRPS